MPEGIEQTDEHASAEPVVGELEIQLWTRRPVCGPRTTAIDRLTELDAAGVIDELEIRTWPEEMPLSADSGHGDVPAVIDRYEQWATDQGLSLRPSFEARTSTTLVSASREVLRLPMLAVAASVDGELVGVYPCTDDGTTWTVPEFIDALDDGLATLPHETAP